MTLRICHDDFIVLYQCKLLSLQHYILWFCLLSMICIARTCFISYWDYIPLQIYMKMIKALGILTPQAKKANLKHIILSEPLLSLFIFSLLYPCIMSHVTKSARRRLGDFSLSWFDLIRWSRHLVIYWRLLGNPGTGLIRDSRVRDWLWLGKVLAPLTHPTWGKLLRELDVLKKF